MPSFPLRRPLAPVYRTELSAESALAGPRYDQSLSVGGRPITDVRESRLILRFETATEPDDWLPTHS